MTQTTVTLKKAHRIVQQLRAELNNIEPKASYDISIFSDESAAEFLAKSRIKLGMDLNLKLRILELISEIRILVQEVNEKEGINMLIARRKALLEQIVVLKALLAKKDPHDMWASRTAAVDGAMLFTDTTLQNALDARRRTEGEKKEVIHVNIVNENEEAAYRDMLLDFKKRLDEYNDILAAKNATLTINLYTIELQRTDLFKLISEQYKML